MAVVEGNSSSNFPLDTNQYFVLQPVNLNEFVQTERYAEENGWSEGERGVYVPRCGCQGGEAKGSSPPAKLTVKLRSESQAGDIGHDWIYGSAAVVLVVAVVLAYQIFRNLFHKWKVKAARNSYFKSFEERDAMSQEWAIMPLNEDYSPWKILDENLPREKWDIGFENLVIGDVIGQGAFGIVRRAKMRREKYRELQRKHRKTRAAAQLIPMDEVGAEGFETVAVKMLKVAATTADRDDLIKEIVTMQNLGSHPQIVSMLGACTPGRSLCLVMEYCPGGDLLSFLRKVREKYWPLLNLGMGARRASCSSWEGLICEKSVGDRLKCGSDDRGTRSGNSKICYADIVTSSRKSLMSVGLSSEITPGPPSPSGGTLPRDTVGERTQSDGPEEQPVHSKDVLSYARQIALGMGYLERNRIVHRDLACRNILVMGDYRQVKISDFGLSRDIYTWNVYHQKSDGKLPFKWMALESISSPLFTSKSDVWSCGILLWELVTLGGNPYPALGNHELYSLLKSGYRMERPENCSEELYAVMRKCWRTAPVDRPNFLELCLHLEMMLDSAEPELYLSLRAVIPVEPYSGSSRSDLPEIKGSPIPHYLPVVGVPGANGRSAGLRPSPPPLPPITLRLAC